MKCAMIVFALMLTATSVSARDNPPPQTTFVEKKWAGSEAWLRSLNPNEKVVILLEMKSDINNYIRDNPEKPPHILSETGSRWVGFTQFYANLMLSRAAAGNNPLSLNFSMSADNALLALNGEISKNDYIDRSSRLAFEIREMAYSIDDGYARKIRNIYSNQISDASTSILIISMDMAKIKSGYNRHDR